MIRAIYPGSFDPFHNGHRDIARRAALIFNELIVAVLDAPTKNLLFSTTERMQLVQESLENLNNVRVVPYEGLTVQWAYQQGAQVIVRGLRDIEDFTFEARMGLANRHMVPTIETCYLLCSTEYAYLSSTILKEVASLKGDISRWVTPHTAQVLRQRRTRTPVIREP